jgi:hypothetical protein
MFSSRTIRDLLEAMMSRIHHRNPSLDTPRQVREIARVAGYGK